MRLFSYLTVTVIFLVSFSWCLCSADLGSEKQALLEFSAQVPHGNKVNWSNDTQICTHWVGITCNSKNTHVVALRLPGVGLVGQIPNNTIGLLDGLEVLSMRSNSLTGTLPSDIFSLPSLHSIYLQHNYFSGEIPSSFSPHLSSLDLSFNSLDGRIPASVANLTHLTKLFLQNNSLVGPIPNLKLPLKYLNLSTNHLTGSIPSILGNFSKSSFQGNIGLCGSPLSPCSSITPHSSPMVPKRKGAPRMKISRVAIIIIAVTGVVIFIIFLVMLLCYLRKKNNTGAAAVLKGKAFAGGRSEKPKEDFGSGVQEAERNKLFFFEGCSFNFDLEDLLRASAEVLGKGSYGTTYKAILEDGTTVVVKRLKEVVVGKREFDQQMEIIGRIDQHQNVVPLRAYYYSKDEKLLVYDYVPAGSLLARLHGSKDGERSGLKWESRVKILVGAARGIMHIHSSMGGKVTHGNIKSSNVLGSCISEFGLTPVMSYAVVPPSRNVVGGYRAPETVETRKPTQKSDVYSFGVLVLEMLTGKVPVQSPSKEEAFDLPRWVQSVLKEEWTSEVFDVELTSSNSGPSIEEELVQMLQIGLACVSKSPDMRPGMEEVVKWMEEIIKSSDSSSRQSPASPSPTPSP